MEQTVDKKRVTFTDQMRLIFKGVLDPIGAFLNRIGLTPNIVTSIGLVGNVIGAILLSQGEMLWGGIVVLLMGPVDALDGTMARLRGEASDWGAFIDSVTDRYSELIIFSGLLFYFVQQEMVLAAMLTFAAASGSVMVSYVKSRAESLGYDAKIGILTRMERYMVLAPGLVINQPLIALWIIAILANITALQRFYYVRKQAYKGRLNLK